MLRDRAPAGGTAGVPVVDEPAAVVEEGVVVAPDPVVAADPVVAEFQAKQFPFSHTSVICAGKPIRTVTTIPTDAPLTGGTYMTHRTTTKTTTPRRVLGKRKKSTPSSSMIGFAMLVRVADDEVVSTSWNWKMCQDKINVGV